MQKAVDNGKNLCYNTAVVDITATFGQMAELV